MRYKNAVVIILTILMLVAMGFGISIIYSDYIYDPLSGFTRLYVNVIDISESHYLFGTDPMEDAPLFKAVEEWAKEEQATVIFKDSFSYTAGCGFCGYSDWARINLGIDDYKENTKGVYILDEPALFDAYVNGDIFLPESAGLKILGTYSDEDLPPILEGEDFLYPLSIATGARGMYFTDAKNFDKFIEIFDKKEYYVDIFQRTNTVTPTELIHTLLTDSILSQSLFFAMIGLVFCFIYSILLIYKENIRRMCVHYLFGLSKKRILFIIFAFTVGTILASISIFSVSLLLSLTYMGMEDLRKIFAEALIFFSVLTVFVNVAGYAYSLRQLRPRRS